MLQLSCLRWCEKWSYHSHKKSIVCSLHFSTFGLQPTFHTQSFCPPSAVCSLLSPVSVILLPLRAASLTHKNSQGQIIIHSPHPLGNNDQSIHRKIFLKNTMFDLKCVVKATSNQKSNIVSSQKSLTIIFGTNRQNYFHANSPIQLFLFQKRPCSFYWWTLHFTCIFAIYEKHVAEQEWRTRFF